MKMAMRLDKSQMQGQTLKKFTDDGTFNRDLFVMAGFTTFEAFLVGAAGGGSGNVGKAQVSMQYSCGGGGGGTLHLLGKLTDIPSKTAIVVGKAGANGSNEGIPGPSDTTPVDGKDGGTTSFDTHQAFGGKGANGGRWGSDSYLVENSVGGDGGGNSAGLGAGGVGGKASSSSSSNNSTAPTVGTFVAGGTYPVVGGGKGGGGGPGEAWFQFSKMASPKAGAAGSDGSVWMNNGQPAGNHAGGTGGGAYLEPLLGVVERYGSDPVDGSSDGVVVVKIS